MIVATPRAAKKAFDDHCETVELLRELLRQNPDLVLDFLRYVEDMHNIPNPDPQYEHPRRYQLGAAVSVLKEWLEDEDVKKFFVRIIKADNGSIFWVDRIALMHYDRIHYDEAYQDLAKLKLGSVSPHDKKMIMSFWKRQSGEGLRWLVDRIRDEENVFIHEGVLRVTVDGFLSWTQVDLVIFPNLRSDGPVLWTRTLLKMIVYGIDDINDYVQRNFLKLEDIEKSVGQLTDHEDEEISRLSRRILNEAKGENDEC